MKKFKVALLLILFVLPLQLLAREHSESESAFLGSICESLQGDGYRVEMKDWGAVQLTYDDYLYWIEVEDFYDGYRVNVNTIVDMSEYPAADVVSGTNVVTKGRPFARQYMSPDDGYVITDCVWYCENLADFNRMIRYALVEVILGREKLLECFEQQ